MSQLVDKRKNEIIKLLQNSYVTLNAVLQSTFADHDYVGVQPAAAKTFRLEVHALSELIERLTKNIGRMKSETYEKRYEEIRTRLGDLVMSYSYKRRIEQEQEYAALLEESSEKTVDEQPQVEEDVSIREPKKEGQLSLVVKGDKRRGRKPIGEKRKVSINLEEEQWTEIERFIRNGEIGSFSEFFRIATDSFIGNPKANAQ